VPRAVFEVKFPIPPDGSAHMDPYIEVLDDPPHIVASHKRLRYKDYVDQGSSAATLIDDTTTALIDNPIGVSIDNNNAASIDDPIGVSIDNNNPTSIDTLRMS